jgi:hypothetical protein
MKAVYGLYPDPDSAQRAVDLLRDAHVEDRSIVVLSSEPFDDYEFGRRDHKTIMPWLAALGGLLGGTSAFAFVAFTQKAYPLSTGGMPIVSLWPNGIITYEFTMFGAILTTLVALIITTRSPRDSANVFDTEVSEGKILIGVVNPPEASLKRVEQALHNAGAPSVVQWP